MDLVCPSGIQEVFYESMKNFHLCFEHSQRLITRNRTRTEATEWTDTVNVSDVKMTDDDSFLSRSMMIKIKNIIMKERMWTGLVTSKNETQPLHDERIITVREEPSLHVESHQRRCN